MRSEKNISICSKCEVFFCNFLNLYIFAVCHLRWLSKQSSSQCEERDVFGKGKKCGCLPCGLFTMPSIEESLFEAESVHSISQEVFDEIGDESMNCSFFLYSRKCIRGHVFLNLQHSNIVTGKNREKTKANGEPNWRQIWTFSNFILKSTSLRGA